jgi:hypothetical protein
MFRTMTAWRGITAVGLLLMVGGAGSGCRLMGGVGSTQATAEMVGDTSTATAGADGPTSTTAAVGRAVDVGGVALPRTVTYTGMEFTVTKAAAASDGSHGSAVALDVTLHNTASEEQQVEAAWVSLRTPDGTRLEADGLSDPSVSGDLRGDVLDVSSGGRVTRTFFVPVEGALRLADTRFSVANTRTKGIPAEVPLSGAVSRSPFPIDLTVPTEKPTFPGKPPFTVSFRSAQLVEEWQDRRAEVGKHLVVLQFGIVSGTCDLFCTDPAVGEATVRLVIDGTPYDALEQDPSGCCLLRASETHDLTEVYALPDRYSSVSLVVQGDTNKSNPEQHPLAFTIPPLPVDGGPAPTGTVPTIRR